MCKLEAGYYGSNMTTLGAYNYRGFDIVVDDGDMSMPLEGGTYRFGIYGLNQDESIDITNGVGFSMEVVVKAIDEVIDSLIHEGYDKVEPSKAVLYNQLLGIRDEHYPTVSNEAMQGFVAKLSCEMDYSAMDVLRMLKRFMAEAV